MKHASRYPAIGDYALLGDGRAAALVSREGALEWLCLPRFESPSMFGALLDRERGGTFCVQPTARFVARRRYLGLTPILETCFATDSGELRLTDCMAVAEDASLLQPEHLVLRRIECVRGEVEIGVTFDPRADYGRGRMRISEHGPLGIFVEGTGVLVLRSEVALQRAPEVAARARITLRAGERRWLALATARSQPAILPPLGEAAEAALRRTERAWTRWISCCRYDGPYREAVLRSALTLKLLTYAPSGAVVAAPTTSLPEWPGGARNWDYRYCWLRDASMTVRAFYELGFTPSAASGRSNAARPRVRWMALWRSSSASSRARTTSASSGKRSIHAMERRSETSPRPTRTPGVINAALRLAEPEAMSRAAE